MNNGLSKKVLLLIISVALLCGIAAVAYAVGNNRAAVNQQQSDGNGNPAPGAREGQSVSKIGVLACLAKLGNGPHTAECAYGFKEDDGTMYELQFDDPTEYGHISFGKKVKITGQLKPPSDSPYQKSGTLQVESVTPLE